MGRPSTIRLLPAAVREALNGWLRDPAITQVEATARVNALLADLDPGHSPVSRKAVNRFDLSMREVGRNIQESREIADLWIDKLGSAPGGKLGHLVVEIIRTVAFGAAQVLARGEISAESLPDVLDSVNKLALAAQRLERSSAESERRERRIRAEERQRAAEEAAETAGRAASEGGLSAGTVAEIRNKILGISA